MSTSPASPTDTLKVYSSPSGYNPAMDPTYFYYDGAVGGSAGWYDADTFGSVGTSKLSAGEALVIRKASGSAERVMWLPELPYVP